MSMLGLRLLQKFFNVLTFSNVFALLIFVFALYILHFYISYYYRENPMPGPLPLPILGNYLQCPNYEDMVVWVEALHKKYGDMWETYTGPQRYIWVARADLVEKMFYSSAKNNYKRRTNWIRAYDEMGILNTGILMNRDLDLWSSNKSTLMRALGSKRLVERYFKLVSKCFGELEGYWEQLGYVENAYDQAFNISDWLHALALDDKLTLYTGRRGLSLASLFHSHSPGSEMFCSLEEMEETRKFRKAWLMAMESWTMPAFVPEFISSVTPRGRLDRSRHQKSYQWLRDELLTIVREKRAELESNRGKDKRENEPTLLDLLLAANDPREAKAKEEDEESGKGLDDENLAGILRDVFIGAMESVSMSASTS
jgi:hypothetical protein